MLQYNDYRYGLKLNDNLHLRLSFFRIGEECYCRVRLFKNVCNHYNKENEWVPADIRESKCKLHINDTRGSYYMFRHLLPNEYSHLHSSVFYVDEFIQN